MVKGEYGRTDATQCTKEGEDPVPKDKLHCRSPDISSALEGCNGLDICHLKVDLNVLRFKDPCPENTFKKYINVSFACLSEYLHIEMYLHGIC